jgi:hypothetical protein
MPWSALPVTAAAHAVAFKPAIPAMISESQSRREAVAASPSSQMPSNTVPTLPIPVQTASAVPMGSVLTAMPSSTTLTTMEMAVKVVGTGRVNPVGVFQTDRPATFEKSGKGSVPAWGGMTL